MKCKAIVKRSIELVPRHAPARLMNASIVARNERWARDSAEEEN